MTATHHTLAQHHESTRSQSVATVFVICLILGALLAIPLAVLGLN